MHVHKEAQIRLHCRLSRHFLSFLILVIFFLVLFLRGVSHEKRNLWMKYWHHLVAHFLQWISEIDIKIHKFPGDWLPNLFLNIHKTQYKKLIFGSPDRFKCFGNKFWEKTAKNCIRKATKTVKITSLTHWKSWPPLWQNSTTQWQGQGLPGDG